MGYLGVIILLLVLVVFIVPQARLRYVLAQTFPSHYSKILRKNLPEYVKMPTDLQLQLKRRIKQFLHQKTFVGCDHLNMTDEIRVTIAGKACLLLLNRDTDVYAQLTHILVYPGAFLAPRNNHSVGGIVTHTNQGLTGESWSDGRVILAWDHIVNHDEVKEFGHDLVLHEFAHQLDSETGSTNGAPALASASEYRRWSQVMEYEFSQLQYAIENNQATVIDHYGATNPAEFFAVATEAYFKKSRDLAQYHPRLFELLRAYYHVDPREWM
jgi:Mlc titration factor MtfA (ptsG expression regulator)